MKTLVCNNFQCDGQWRKKNSAKSYIFCSSIYFVQRSATSWAILIEYLVSEIILNLSLQFRSRWCLKILLLDLAAI